IDDRCVVRQLVERQTLPNAEPVDLDFFDSHAAVLRTSLSLRERAARRSEPGEGLLLLTPQSALRIPQFVSRLALLLPATEPPSVPPRPVPPDTLRRSTGKAKPAPDRDDVPEFRARGATPPVPP